MHLTVIRGLPSNSHWRRLARPVCTMKTPFEEAPLDGEMNSDHLARVA